MLGNALRRARAKVKDRKKDGKLQAENAGKAKETLAEETVVVEKACVWLNIQMNLKNK